MTSFRFTVAVSLVASTSAGALAQDAGTRFHVNGTIVSAIGARLSVKTSSREIVEMDFPDTIPVTITKTYNPAYIMQGMTMGVTIAKGPDGKEVTVEAHPIRKTEPMLSRELAPDVTQYYGTVDTLVVAINGREITLNYKTGTVKALLSTQTLMMKTDLGRRADVKVGSNVLIAGTKTDAGKTTVRSVSVIRRGLMPWQ